MSRAAVALGNTSAPAWRPRRVHLALVAIAIVSVWLVLVFTRSLSDLSRASGVEQSIVDESATLSMRLTADRRELALVQTDSFQRLQARAYGLGEPGELVFSLEADAPAPPPITPLGQSSSAADSASDVPAGPPLDAWLELLFGS